MIEENSLADFLSDVLPLQLADCLLHENNEQFQAALEPYMQDEAISSLRSIFSVIFHALPMSSNHFSFQGVKLPARNDACICGSGKKMKKCCPDILDFPVPKARDLFIMALGVLPESGFEELAQKPNWNLSAADEFLQCAVARECSQAAMILLLPLLDDLSEFRNEHQELISCMLDILFDVGEDDLRNQLMQDISQLKQAPSLQSIAHQRLAMISSQKNDAGQSKYHLQQAFRCDPNQDELPMAEMSILGEVASEEEIKARAKFWQMRLKKKYDEHPVLDFIEEILIHGKALFDDYREQHERELEFESDSEFDPSIQAELERLDRFAESDEYKAITAIENNHAQSLMSLLDSKNADNNYDIIRTGDEAKFSLSQQMKPIYKQWLALYDEAGEEVNELYAEKGVAMDDDDIDYHRWTMPEPDWLDFLQQYPMLMNNFEVLSRLSAHIYQAPTPIEEDEMLENGMLEGDLPEMSTFRQLILIYKQRCAMLVNGMMQMLPEEIYLPRRFKGNDCFWQLADEYEIELHQYNELERQEIFLQQLQGLEKKPHQRIQNSLMLNYFQQGKLTQILELYESQSKPNLSMVLMAASAYQHQGDKQIATGLLAKIKDKNQRLLLAFYQALKEDDATPLLKQVIEGSFGHGLESGIIPLCNQLLEAANQPIGMEGRESKDKSKSDRFMSKSYLWLLGRVSDI